MALSLGGDGDFALDDNGACFSFSKGDDRVLFLSVDEGKGVSFSGNEDGGISLPVDDGVDFSFSDIEDGDFSFDMDDDGVGSLSGGGGRDLSFSGDVDGELSLLCDEAVVFFSEDIPAVLFDEFSWAFFFFDTLLSFDGLDDELDFSFFLDAPSSCPLVLTSSLPDFSVFTVVSILLLSDALPASFFAFMGLGGFFFFFLAAFAILSSPKIFCIIMSNPDDAVSFTTMTLGDLERLIAFFGFVDLFSAPGDGVDLPGVALSFPLVSALFSGEVLSFSLSLLIGVC